MTIAAFTWRRAALVALCVLPLFILFEAYTVYSDMVRRMTARPLYRPFRWNAD